MANFNWPSISVTSSSAPIQFELDSVATTVSQDTSTPASSNPLPVRQLNADGTVFDPEVSEGYLQSISQDQLPASLGQKTMANSLSVAIASDDIVQTSSVSNDILGVQVTGQQYNQIEINFETAPSSALITNTFSGGGSATVTNGHTLYATGTAATSGATGVSVTSLAYRPLHQAYAAFTAAFTVPLDPFTYQRIGLYDASNGFFIGYNGTSFGVTKRSGGSDTFVDQASFNGDLLNGGANSHFTRNGTPEALNKAYSNLYRIRFAWLGSASILFEVFSPDGLWITFHTIKMPNSQYNPSIQNPNLPMTIDVQKATASSTQNLIIATACWAAGTTSTLQKITDTLTDYSLATINRSVICGHTTGGGGSYVNVKVNPSGAITADVSGTVAATQSGTWNITNVSGTVSLPTGASTFAEQQTQSSTLTTISGKLPATLGQKSMANSLAVAIASDQTALNVGNITGTVSLPTGAATESTLSTISGNITVCNTSAVTLSSALPSGTNIIGYVKPSGLQRANAPVYNSYSSTNVTTSAYVQLIASTTGDTSFVSVFDSSGQAMILATGAAGSENDRLYIPPGGGEFPLFISSATRISIKALTATASSGYLLVNLLG